MSVPYRRVCPHPAGRGGPLHPLIPRESKRWKSLDVGPAGLEREFDRLKISGRSCRSGCGARSRAVGDRLARASWVVFAAAPVSSFGLRDPAARLYGKIVRSRDPSAIRWMATAWGSGTPVDAVLLPCIPDARRSIPSRSAAWVNCSTAMRESSERHSGSERALRLWDGLRASRTLRSPLMA